MTNINRRQLLTAGAAGLALTLLMSLVCVAAPPPAAAQGGKLQEGKRVNFTSENTPMAGELFLPSTYKTGHALPAALVVGPWLNVKEQVATNYARRLADAGFAAFIFDFRHWGQSGSEPREYECPADKIADIHNALRVLSEQPQVDKNRIGVLGVCFGVGYVGAAAHDPLIKSVATVATWVHDVPSVTKLFGAEEVARRRRAGQDAMTAYRKDKTVIYVPAGSRTDKTAAMYSADPNFYYNTARRGVIPQWTNRFAVLGWDEWLDFDGVSQGANITQPLLMVHSDGSALPDNARRFFALAKGPKQLVWMDGEHTQFYDTEPQITQAANAVAAHFAQTLMTPGEQAQWSRMMHAQESVRGVVADFPPLADGRDWAGLRALFADDVYADYTSVAGGTPGVVKADDLVAGWQKGLERYAHTKHNFSPADVTVDGDTAVADFTGQATHVRDANGTQTRWSCGGNYEYKLARTPQGWKVTSATFHMTWEQGER